MRPIIPILYAKQPEFRYGHNGHPVWPVWSASQFKALRRLTLLFGAGLRPCAGTVTFDSRPRREGVVGWLGRECREPAMLYAHLTGRRCGPFEPSHAGYLAVLITTFPRIEAELLETLYPLSRYCAIAPGMIAAATVPQLWTQVLLRSAALCLAPSMPFRRVDLNSTLDIKVHDFSALPWRILGGCAAKQVVASELRAGSALLAFSGHSDGVDAKLLDDLTLCPRSGWRDVGIPRPPRCHHNGFCHRQEMAVGDATVQGRLLGVGKIRAGILVASCCTGYLTPGAIVDWRWGFGHQLACSLNLGAVAISWRIFSASRTIASPLADLLSQDLSAGKAVAIANAQGDSFCLFGDPDFHLTPPPLMAALLSQGSSASTSIPLPPPPDIRQLAAVRKLVDLWWASSRQCAVASGVPCPHCKAPLALRLAEAGEAWGGLRRVGICPRCGIVEDVPDSSGGRIDLNLTTGALAFRRRDGKPAGAGIFVFRSHDPKFHVILNAPHGTAIVPQAILALREPVVVSFLWQEDAAPAQVLRPFYPGSDD